MLAALPRLVALERPAARPRPVALPARDRASEVRLSRCEAETHGRSGTPVAAASDPAPEPAARAPSPRCGGRGRLEKLSRPMLALAGALKRRARAR
jgi:hypothetical protein